LVLLRHPGAEWVDQYRYRSIHNELMTASPGFFFLNLWGIMVGMGYLWGLLFGGVSRRIVWLNYIDVSVEPAAPISMDDGRIISQKTTVNM